MASVGIRRRNRREFQIVDLTQLNHISHAKMWRTLSPPIFMLWKAGEHIAGMSIEYGGGLPVQNMTGDKRVSFNCRRGGSSRSSGNRSRPLVSGIDASRTKKNAVSNRVENVEFERSQ
jgi:hypothetical protein